MQKIFIGGKFYHPIATEDIRSKLVGSIDLQTQEIPINNNYKYIGPFFSIKASDLGNAKDLPQNIISEQYADKEHEGYASDHRDAIIEEEMKMISNCDIFIGIFLDQSPGTIIEILKAVSLNKKIFILSTKELQAENWYVYRYAQMNTNFVEIITVQNFDDIQKWFKNHTIKEQITYPEQVKIIKEFLNDNGFKYYYKIKKEETAVFDLCKPCDKYNFIEYCECVFDVNNEIQIYDVGFAPKDKFDNNYFKLITDDFINMIFGQYKLSNKQYCDEIKPYLH